MESEKFCLRWNDFESNISEAFRELREEKDFFDVTLACDDTQLQAHKVILSACSPFFRNVLRRNPHQHPLLFLKGIKYKELQSVLTFMYMGEVNIAQEELASFLAVAEDLKVKGLTQNKTEGQKLGSNAPKQEQRQIIQQKQDKFTPAKKQKIRQPTKVSKVNVVQEDLDSIQAISEDIQNEASTQNKTESQAFEAKEEKQEPRQTFQTTIADVKDQIPPAKRQKTFQPTLVSKVKNAPIYQQQVMEVEAAPVKSEPYLLPPQSSYLHGVQEEQQQGHVALDERLAVDENNSYLFEGTGFQEVEDKIECSVDSLGKGSRKSTRPKKEEKPKEIEKPNHAFKAFAQAWQCEDCNTVFSSRKYAKEHMEEFN